MVLGLSEALSRLVARGKAKACNQGQKSWTRKPEPGAMRTLSKVCMLNKLVGGALCWCLGVKTSGRQDFGVMHRGQRMGDCPCSSHLTS